MATIWITGASSGIGRALALQLAQAGHTLIVSARSEARLLALRETAPHPERIHVLRFDLADERACARAAADAVRLAGSIDVVILNGGLAQRSLVHETTLEAYRHIMEVNFFANVALSKALLPHFESQGSGHYVVVSSLVGKFGTPYRSGYAASKHALHGFFDSLRAELMSSGKKIDVTMLCPGFVATELSFHALGASGQATQVYDEANARGLAPEDFARRAIAAIMARKYEVTIGGKETFGIILKRFFPSLFVRTIAKVKVR